MARIEDDDPLALEILLERYWAPILLYAERLLPRFEDAEDVAQEVFVRVWSHRSRWEPTRGTAQAYLYRIARNLILNRSRHAEVRQRTEIDVVESIRPVETPFEAMVQSELRVAFESALYELPERRRQAFTLVRLQGLSLREAGDVMEISPQTVANHVYLASTDLVVDLGHFLT